MRRHQCSGGGRSWRPDTSAAAEPRSKLSRGALTWALTALVVGHLTVIGVAGRLGMSWHTANTCVAFLTDWQRARIDAVFAIEEHAEAEATWAVYQRTVTAYRHPDRAAGGHELQTLIDSLRHGVPDPLTELGKPDRTLHHRVGDVLADFDMPGTSNGPTEAINGRLEHLRGSAFGFRKLSNYITRSPLEGGGLGHPNMRCSAVS